MPQKCSDSDGSDHHSNQDPDHGNVAVGTLPGWNFGLAKDAECDPERSSDDSQGLYYAENASRCDRADSDETHIAAIDLHRRHIRDRNRGRIHGAAQMAADEPD